MPNVRSGNIASSAAVEEGGEVRVLRGLGDGPAGVAVDPPGPAARLVQQLHGGAQGGVPYAAAVGRTDQLARRGAQHVLAAQGAAQPAEQADDAQQGEGEQHDRAAQDDGRLGHAVADRVGHDQHGGDEAGEAQQHDEAPHAGQPVGARSPASGVPSRGAGRRGRAGPGPTNQPAAELRPVGHLGRDARPPGRSRGRRAAGGPSRRWSRPRRSRAGPRPRARAGAPAR